MFHKKYKVKTSTALKGSDRKRLKSLVEVHLSMPIEDINSLISSKSEISQTKAMTHNSVIVTIYSFSSVPLFFLVQEKIFPTVFLLWKYPNLLPTLTTTNFVFEKMSNGADLMAPGILVSDETLNEFQSMKVGDVAAVRLCGNMAPIAVGTAAMSADDLCVDGCKGKAILISHCYKDTLWSSCDEQIPLPFIPEPAPPIPVEEASEPEVAENAPDFENVNLNDDLSKLDIEDSSSKQDLVLDDNLNEDVETVPYSMDELLQQCFMTSLKVNGNKIGLPVLTSTFYRTYLLQCCPSDFNLDIKKTSFKKLSPFLKSMSSLGLIEVKELMKGVESIVKINLDHELLIDFVPDKVFRAHLKLQKEHKAEEKKATDTVQNNYEFPVVAEMVVVSAQVKSLFEAVRIRKGEALSPVKVREVLRDYVKNNSLQDPSNPRLVQLDPILSHSLLKSSDTRLALSWEELYEITVSRMSPAFEITFPGEPPKLKKGNIDPVDVTIATRTGNKKVTLINNLDNFGINPEKLANYVQVAVAASTSVGPAPNGKGTQVLIQGNQLRYLQTLFFDIYKVPRKYVRGLDNVPAKKKK